MLGTPKEHVEKTLRDYVTHLKDDKTVHIHKEDYASAEKRGELYATFVEIDMTFKDVYHLIAFCFDAMPGSVEILEPLELKMPAKDFEGLINDLQARLHSVDMALKNLKATNQVIDMNAVNVLHNLIIYACKQTPKTAEELAAIAGLPADKIPPFLEKLVMDNRIKKSGTTYTA